MLEQHLIRVPHFFPLLHPIQFAALLRDAATIRQSVAAPRQSAALFPSLAPHPVCGALTRRRYRARDQTSLTPNTSPDSTTPGEATTVFPRLNGHRCQTNPGIRVSPDSERKPCRRQSMTFQMNSLSRRIARILVNRGSFIALLILGQCGGFRAESRAQGYSAEDAPRHMTLPAELEVRCVASEPMIVQPVCLEFDDRGRPWVLQYIQYPNPAELKRARVDRWSRTTYDRVPAPPPRGPKGSDRITILEDTNRDGRADIARDFVSGLNLATGLAFGHGGVFVLNVPYLLFYPDRDRNDVPDSDPEVCVTGFGMDDAHSVAN